ncbi:MAG: peroxidase family protein [Pseudomonadota bacterium]
MRMFQLKPMTPVSKSIRKIIVEKTLTDEPPAQATSVKAHYTYIAQMIAHDIVPSTNGSTPGTVTPELDFGSMYGHSASDQQRIQALNKHGKFVFGSLKNVHDSDLARTGGVAEIPDSRNDENHLISQMHLWWQKYHNTLIDEGLSTANAIEVCSSTFQAVAMLDFAKNTLAKGVFDYYIRNQPWFYGPFQDYSGIPEEFSLAAFRFGHSMILHRYLLRFDRPPVPGISGVEIGKMFRSHNPNIDDSFIVNWNDFSTQAAARIDTAFPEAMGIAPFHGKKKNIVNINIKAGEKAQLARGPRIVAEIKNLVPELSELVDLRPLTGAPARGRLRGISGLDYANMPLWLYLLEESDNAPQSKGDRLGPLASLLVGEVLFSAVRLANKNLFDNRGNTESIRQELGPLGTWLTENNRAVTFISVVDYVNERNKINV